MNQITSEIEPGQLVSWAMEQPLALRDKMVLTVLAHHTDSSGECSLPVSLLAQYASLSDRSVQHAIHVLVSKNLVKVWIGGGRNRPNTYKIQTPKTEADTVKSNADTVKDTTQRVKDTTQTVKSATNTVKSVQRISPPSAPLLSPSPLPPSPPPPLPFPPTPPHTIPSTSPLTLSTSPLIPPISPPSQTPRASGFRLPETWNPGREGAKFAVALGLNPQETFAKFQDYWLSKAGKDARKVDWQRTWQNWCRSEASRRSPKPSPDDFFDRRAYLEAPPVPVSNPL